MRQEVSIALWSAVSTIAVLMLTRGSTTERILTPTPTPTPTPRPKPNSNYPELLDPWAAEERAAAERDAQYPVPAQAWRVEEGPWIVLEPTRMYAAKFDVSFPASMGASKEVVRERLAEFTPWVALSVWQEPSEIPKDYPIQHASTKQGGVYYCLGVPRGLVRVERADVDYLAELMSRDLFPSERG